ncbi:hypothetical protein [Marinimicrobium sp. ABcell2]|uniref:hypothetical protein n=1 Tax=Marinimicrobium sp. ABcell2 TaxID=3069751 RepID=UPI0027B3B3DB|nr:hypothetical protein [Marinimicrobium sp. ABcell2]MDQ2076680.1 hypothetical protein [Marinimicrobium sp. ABcell2]
MLDVTSPFAWLWAASLLVMSVVVFKRNVLYFYLIVTPPLIALKLGLPLLIVAAGVTAVLVGIMYSVLCGELRGSVSTEHENDPRSLAYGFQLRLPLIPSIALVLVGNVGLAWLVLQFFDPNLWFQEKGISARSYLVVYMVAGFVSALGMFMPLVRIDAKK